MESENRGCITAPAKNDFIQNCSGRLVFTRRYIVDAKTSELHQVDQDLACIELGAAKVVGQQIAHEEFAL